MKHIAFIVAIAIATNLLGQDAQNAAPAADFKKVQLGVSFSPDYCYRNVVVPPYSRLTFGDFELKEQRAGDKAEFGFTTGFTIVFNLKRTFGIETGIQYANMGFQTKTHVYPDGEKIKNVYTANYLNIPVKANFSFGHKHVRFTTGAGVVTNFPVGKNWSGNRYYHDDVISLTPVISAGIDWKINDARNLKIEPTFRYNFDVIRFFDDTDYARVINYTRVDLWSVGLNVSYYFGGK